MNILITGGAGYIGSHTVLALKEAGHMTVVLDNLSRGHREYLFADQFVEGNAGNATLVRQALQRFHIEAIIHFAAFIEAGESMQNPALFFQNNTAETASLLNCIPGSSVRAVIFSSTAAVYGIPDTTPIREEAPTRPINPYGESKLMVEQMLRWISEIHGIRYAALRYFNAAGADPEGRTGELHNPETHLIPLALQTAYGKREKMFVYGTDYDTKDGSCIRDYIHVSDLAMAHVAALDYLVKGGESSVFNIGSESGYSVKEIIAATKMVTGIDFPVEEGPRRPGDPAILVASAEKIKTLTGWTPRFTEPKEIIETAHRFYKKWYRL